MPTEQPHSDTGRSQSNFDEDMDLWKRKYQALKTKCREYQEVNEMLFLRAKRIHHVIERAEAETRYLVKKLEQYEEVDYPKCLPSARAEAGGLTVASSHFLSPVDPNHQQLFRAAAATRIRTEVELALSQDNVPSIENGAVPNRAHHSVHESIQMNVPSRASTERSSVQTTAHSNPSVLTSYSQSTTLQGPPRLVPIPSPSPVPVPDKSPLGPPKTKRFKRNFKGADRQLKPGLKGAAAAKRRKGEIDPNAPKKPSNAFFWFCQARRPALQEQFKGEGTTGQHDLTKALARLWGETSAEDKKPYYEQYTLDKARYDQEMEEFTRMKQASILPSPSVPAATNQIGDTSTCTVTITDPEL